MRLELVLVLAILTRVKTDSDTCNIHVQQYKDGVTAKESWALQMFDSGTKVPDGLLYGNTKLLGNFDECMELTTPEFTGRFCRVKVINITVTNPKLTPSLLPLQYALLQQQKLQWSVCAPSTCYDEGVRDVVSYNMAHFGLEVTSEVISVSCIAAQDPEIQLDATAWAWISTFILLVLIAASASIYDYHVTSRNGDVKPWVEAFSIQRNWNSLWSHSPGKLRCVHGIRAFSMAWVVLGHRYGAFWTQANINALPAQHFKENWAAMMIEGGLLSVETFFLLSGLLVTYIACSGALRGRPFNLLHYYVNRYVRLSTPLAFHIFYMAALSDKMYLGPMREQVANLATACKERWWATLLYINNWLDDKTCAGQSWYLSVDMQFAILAPFLVIPLLRWPRATLGVMSLLTLASLIGLFVVAYVYELFWVTNGSKYWALIIRNTPLRAVPYLIGLALGWALSRPSKWWERVPRWVWPVGWVVNTAMCLAVVFTVSIAYQPGYQLQQIDSALYNSLHALGWALGIAFIIVACVAGKGGPVNSILGWRGMEPFAKLSYCYYLTHSVVIFGGNSCWRNPHYFSDLNAIYMFLGDMFIVFVPSLTLHLLVEAPTGILLKNALGKSTSTAQKQMKST